VRFDDEQRDELRRKLAEFAETRNDRLRDELVEAHLGLAEYLARRFSNRGEPLDDLVQVASLGLIKAVDRFDPGREVEFSTYATHTIVGELKRHFRDKGWALHVPRDLQERALALSRATERLSHDLGRSPTISELANALGCGMEQVVEASEVAHSYAASLVELLGRHDDGFELAERREVIAGVWRSLTDLERQVIALRFVDGLTQREIGQRIGYSQMHVSRLLRRSLNRLLASPSAEAP
jgi:RNA polymerase sigma-B factor